MQDLRSASVMLLNIIQSNSIMKDEFDIFVNAVGKKIKHLRKLRGLSQEDMEKNDGVPLRTIQNIETGKSIATLKSIFRIAKRLKVHPKELVDVKWKR